MNVHRWLDVRGQRNMWRRKRPPVESAPGDAERLLSAPPEELHPPVGPAKLTWRQRGASGGVVEERFTFPSPAPSGDAAVDAVHGVRLRRAGTTPPRPGCALVMAHGAYAKSHGKALMFLPPAGRAEWDTVLVELPDHMRRQRADSQYSGQFLVSADVPRLVRGMLQGEADLRALVGGLRREGYGRIVLGGLSLGGNAVLQAVTRVGVEGAFAIVPAADAYVSLWETVLGECIAPAGRSAGFSDDLARRTLRLITPLHIGRPAIAAGRILLVYGRNDLLCPPGPIEELRRAWGNCPARVLDAGHVTLVLWYRTVRRIVAAWMRATAGPGL